MIFSGGILVQVLLSQAYQTSFGYRSRPSSTLNFVFTTSAAPQQKQRFGVSLPIRMRVVIGALETFEPFFVRPFWPVRVRETCRTKHPLSFLDYEEFIGAKKHLVLGLLSHTG